MWSFHWWFCIVKFWVKWRSVKECKLASADWHLQVCILSQRELTNLDKNLWAIIWPEKVILKEWQQEQQQTAKTTTIVSLRYRKKQSIVCQICGKRYFRMVSGTFFVIGKDWSFLGFGWFCAILDKPYCAMSVQNGACACDVAFLFFIYFSFFFINLDRAVPVQRAWGWSAFHIIF